MNLTNALRKKIIKLTGYWVYKKKHLPVGTDLFEDLTSKININIKTVFDIGANIGQTAFQYHAAFPNSHILSFEPIRATFEILKNNTKSSKNIDCYNIAFGETVGIVEVKLFDESQSYLNSLKLSAMNPNDSAKTEKIQVDTIDEFLKNNKQIDSIDLLKIDTEGFEIQVLKGANEAIQNGKIKLIYLEAGFSKSNHRSSYYPEIHDFLDSNGFSFFGLYEIAQNEIADKYHFGNALFIHDSLTKYLEKWGQR